MFQGYLTFGCTEIANTSRAAGQARDAGCPIWWLEADECDTLPDAVHNSQPYDRDSIYTAPWYDKDDPVSARFLGIYPVRIEGIENSTRTATIVQGIANGGDISGRRSAVKTVRMVAELVAYGQDALEYGIEWLSAAMESDDCSAHDGTCGESDLTFFASCPPVRRPGEEEEDYQEAVDRATRMLHGVSAISGPTIMERHERPSHGEYGAFGYLVEVVFACANPFVFSLPRRAQSPTSAGQIIQDIPYNLAKYPSAELATASVPALVVATNYSANPSLEVDATGWGASSTGGPGFTASGGRSQDLAARGSWSYRNRLIGTSGSGAPGTLTIVHSVALPAAVTGERFSFSVWAALAKVDPFTASTINGITVDAYWNDPLNTVTPIASSTLAADLSGRVYSAKSVQRPTGATEVFLRIVGNVTWRDGSDLRLYADAAAITKP